MFFIFVFVFFFLVLCLLLVFFFGSFFFGPFLLASFFLFARIRDAGVVTVDLPEGGRSKEALIVLLPMAGVTKSSLKGGCVIAPGVEATVEAATGVVVVAGVVAKPFVGGAEPGASVEVDPSTVAEPNVEPGASVEVEPPTVAEWQIQP